MRQRLSLLSEIPGHQLMLFPYVPSHGLSGRARCALFPTQPESEDYEIPFIKEETEPRRWSVMCPKTSVQWLSSQDANPGPWDSGVTLTAS